MTDIKKLHRKWMQKPEYRAAYQALEPEFLLAMGKSPEKTEMFLTKLFEDYTNDRDNNALRYGLLIIAQAKGMQHLESLFVKKDLRFKEIASFLREIGYCLTVKKIEHSVESYDRPQTSHPA
ncbi:MAG: hypothetical protein ACKO96_02680 [Flammeovirgaceae bacterium]